MATLRLSGLASGMDTETMIKEMMKAQSQKKIDLEKSKTKLEWKKDVWKDVNKKIYDFYTKSLQKMKRSSTYLQNTVSVSDTSMMEVKAGSGTAKGVHRFKIKQLATSSSISNNHSIFQTDPSKDLKGSTKLTGNDEDITFKISGTSTSTPTEITVNGNDTLESLISKINKSDAGVKVSFDDGFDSINISSTTMGSDSLIKIESVNDAAKDMLNNLQIPNTNGMVSGIAGQKAQFYYNDGTTFFQADSNTFTFNNMELNLKGVSEPETISVVVGSNAEAVYEDVKEFITDYNKLITELNEKLNASKAKGYEPLTSEEKKAMATDDVALWEKTIKDSLLRDNNVLQGTLTFMRSKLSLKESYGSEINSLAEIGIVTGKYTEKGLLHIEGDEDELLLSSKDNKLKEAIEKNPEELQQYFSGLATEIYTGLTEKMSSNKLSSAFTLYNDKEMDKEIKNKEEEIAIWEKKLVAIENRYYKQFTAMEQMMQKMNSQSTSLMSMLGG